MTSFTLTFISLSPTTLYILGASRLHCQLWALIIRHVIAPPIDPNRFNPPLVDFECVSGFAGSSTTFRDIVQVLKDEMLVVSFSGIEEIGTISARRAKHLEIMHPWLLSGSHILDRISRFSQLTSFSVVSVTEPMEFLYRLQSLAIYQTLQSIDIGGEWSSIFILGNYSKSLPQSSVLSFPKLTQLRLSEEYVDTFCEDILQEQIMRDMSVFFSGCRNLQLLSIHVPLDKEDDIFMMREVHQSSLEHLVPSEGYERYMTECPICLESYDHTFVVRSENMSARIFAEKLLNLSEIRWMNIWAGGLEEDSQRQIEITRQGSTTKLTRDDGREESPTMI